MDMLVEQVDLNALKQFDGFLEGCKGRTKWASENAIRHIYMALEIASIDPSMAAFRAVCAEEEAATALINSLKEQKYQGSDRINFRNHADKHAVIIFIGAVMEWFDELKTLAGSQFGKHRLYFDDVGKRRALRLGIQLGDTDMQLNPTPPLHIFTQGPVTLAQQFENRINKMLGTESVADIRKSIEERANFRNTILYATPLGIPKASGDIVAFISNQMGKVSSLLSALALIDPWRAPKYPQSEIVTVSIDIFTRLMLRVKPSEPNPMVV